MAQFDDVGSRGFGCLVREVADSDLEVSDSGSDLDEDRDEEVEQHPVADGDQCVEVYGVPRPACQSVARLVCYCRTASTSHAPRDVLSSRICANNCALCEPLVRAFLCWIRSPPPNCQSGAEVSDTAPRPPDGVRHGVVSLLATELLMVKKRCRGCLPPSLPLSILSFHFLSLSLSFCPPPPQSFPPLFFIHIAIMVSAVKYVLHTLTSQRSVDQELRTCG